MKKTKGFSKFEKELARDIMAKYMSKSTELIRKRERERERNLWLIKQNS